MSSASFDSQASVRPGELEKEGGGPEDRHCCLLLGVVILITEKVECPVDGVSLAVAGLARFFGFPLVQQVG